nr:MAG TPA: hypothetical protein [Caudoviricetes sp.]
MRAILRPKSVASDFLLKVLVTFALCSLNSPVPIERNNMLVFTHSYYLLS